MHTRSLLAAIVVTVLGLVSPSWAKSPPPILISLHVSAANDGSGFTSPDLDESRREVLDEIKDHDGHKGKKEPHFLIVTDPSVAEIRLRIDRRHTGRYSSAMVGEGAEHLIAATLSVGDYSTPLVTDGPGDYMWSSAADSLVNKLNAWVTTNLEQILARRPKTP